jgi:hypothetical protein
VNYAIQQGESAKCNLSKTFSFHPFNHPPAVVLHHRCGVLLMGSAVEVVGNACGAVGQLPVPVVAAYKEHFAHLQCFQLLAYPMAGAGGQATAFLFQFFLGDAPRGGDGGLNAGSSSICHGCRVETSR